MGLLNPTNNTGEGLLSRTTTTPKPTKAPFILKGQGKQVLKDTFLGIPRAFSEVIGQPSFRAYAGIAEALTGKTLTPTGDFQKDLFGTDKEITARKVGREFTFRDPEVESKGAFKAIDPILGVGVGLLDATPTGRQIRALLRLGKNSRSFIAGSKDVKEISKVLKSEIPELTDDVADSFSRVFREVDNVNDVDSAINKIEFEFNKAGTTPQTSTGLVRSSGGITLPKRAAVDTTPTRPIIKQPLDVADGAASVDIHPEELRALQGIQQETLANNPAKKLNLHFGRSSDTISQQLENAKGTPRARFIEDTVSEAGFKSIDEAQQSLDAYKASRAQQKQTSSLKLSAEGVPLSTRAVQARIDKRNATAGKPGQLGVSGPGTIPAPGAPATSISPEELSLQKSLEGIVPPDTVISPQSLEVDSQLKSSYTDSIQQKILDAKAAAKHLEEFNEVLPDPTEFPVQVEEVRNMAKAMNLRSKAPKYKDIGNTKIQLRDVTRNTEQVFGKDFKAIEKEILEPFDTAKGQYIDFLNESIDRLDNSVISKFNFQRGSKESQWIQLYGEKKKTLAQVTKQFGSAKAAQIVEADKFFRAEYDSLLAQVNKVEQQIYPNNPEKWTPKRADYYKHFHDLRSGFSRIGNILNNPVKIDPLLSGISEGTAPKSRWASFKQQRLGLKTDEDAVGGFLDYLPSAAYSINIDPHIGKFRELAEILARSTLKTKNLNGYIYHLRHFANHLSGKTVEMDRIFQDHIPGGRRTLSAVDFVNKRVKANTILGNISSSIAQIFNVPQGIADAGKINSLRGLNTTLGQNFVENKAMAQSPFLKERYFKGFNKFDKGMLNNTKKFAVWMVNALDEVGTKFIWNAEYAKALQTGEKNPVRFADVATRKLVAGRGIGEKPLVQNSKIFQVVAPFQLEVTNLWWAMEDLARQKHRVYNPKTKLFENSNGLKTAFSKFDKFATLFVSLYLMNRVAEEVRGHGVAFDPIQAVIDGYDEVKQEPNIEGFSKAGGRLMGEVGSNIPFGQTIASIYPQYGGEVLGVDLPTRKEFFGKEDPTRFGTGLLTTKAVTEPQYKLLPPFGGAQLKKTIGGIKALLAGKSEDKAGRTQFDVGGSFGKNVQAIAFGKYASDEARSFFDDRTSYAEATYQKLLSDPETAEAKFDELIEKNPNLAKAVLKVIEKEQLGITDKDTKMLNLGVANEQRAKAIAKEFNKLKTKQEKAALWDEYVTKKIITEDVSKQLPQYLDI